MGYALAIAVIVAAIGIIVLSGRFRRRTAVTAEAGGPPARPRPMVSEFHVAGEDARVYFEVPLPEGRVDEVLASLLGHEAVEVVREKRHALPIDGVHRVVALGRRDGSWVVATTVELDTPGRLPPSPSPEHLPHASRVEFDVFDHFDDLPPQSPKAAVPSGRETLASFTDEMVLPAGASAALRGQGIDPEKAAFHDVVLGLMRSAGYSLTETGPATYLARRGGQETFIRVVPHVAGHHPELNEQEMRRFVVDFGSSGAPRGLLITEKHSPFEIHERERRDPRIRFVTRERLQRFVDALALG
ncbi:MAG TPA: hypothetical protein VGB41_01495 [Acidimicrobiia bacterium]